MAARHTLRKEKDSKEEKEAKRLEKDRKTAEAYLKNLVKEVMHKDVVDTV